MSTEATAINTEAVVSPAIQVPALTAHDLLAWNEKTSASWRQLLTEHPEVLALPCDIMNTSTVGQLLQHIMACELRYAQRLAEQPISEYADIPYDSAESLYAIHDRAMALVRQVLASPIDWNESIEYMTRVIGPARSARKSILFHIFLHGARHYAQLATIVRKHGIKPGTPMDYLLMDFAPA